MDNIVLSSREYECNNSSLEPLEIFEDPSGLLHGGVGSTIWDTAIVLAKYLEKSSVLTKIATSTSGSRTKLNILELGSGTGLVGLAVARILSASGIKARIVLTDKANVLPLLEKNMMRNPAAGIEIETRVLDWESVSGIKAKPKSMESAHSTVETESSSNTTSESSVDDSDLVSTEWDLVILSDCIWFPSLYPPLIGTLNRLIQPSLTNNPQLIVAFEKRNFSEEMEFFAALGKTFSFRDVKPEEQDPNYQSEDIYLFHCQRRPSSQ
ncbi:Methyltransferase-like protein 21D [Linnemannia zychae]|nr:Methyltransferase-like protein 21D [Linnemannia zychae]